MLLSKEKLCEGLFKMITYAKSLHPLWRAINIWVGETLISDPFSIFVKLEHLFQKLQWFFWMQTTHLNRIEISSNEKIELDLNNFFLLWWPDIVTLHVCKDIVYQRGPLYKDAGCWKKTGLGEYVSIITLNMFQKLTTYLSVK